MNKYVKGALIFTGGVTVGTAVGAGLVIAKAITTAKIKKAIVEVLADKIDKIVYGEEPFEHTK